MARMREFLLRKYVAISNQRGQTATEYLLIVGVVVVAVIAAAVGFGGEIKNLVSEVGKKIMPK